MTRGRQRGVRQATKRGGTTKAAEQLGYRLITSKTGWRAKEQDKKTEKERGGAQRATGGRGAAAGQADTTHLEHGGDPTPDVATYHYFH